MKVSVEKSSACDLAPAFEEICAAYAAGPAVGDQPIPLIEESRELLRLFVRIGSDDLRSALVRLLQTMVDADPADSLTSDAPSPRNPSGANRPAPPPRP